MAKLVLKDVIKCECGKDMFVFALDKENKVITYMCIDECCGNKVEMTFDEAMLSENERFKYFCLNDDGQMTWKCYNHGYCDFDVEWFANDWVSKAYKFIEYGCALEADLDEIEEMFENPDERIEELRDLFAHLEDEQIEMIADEMGIMIEDDLYFAFFDEFQTGLFEGFVDSWEDFKEQIISTMFDLDLCLNE